MFQIYSYDIGESIRIHNLQERMSELMLPGAELVSAGVLHAFTRGFPELMLPGAELNFRRRSSRLYARISFRMKLM